MIIYFLLGFLIGIVIGILCISAIVFCGLISIEKEYRNSINISKKNFEKLYEIYNNMVEDKYYNN